jgi:lipoate---protein ligase
LAIFDENLFVFSPFLFYLMLSLIESYVLLVSTSVLLKNMICINSQYTCPFFNIASEEYFLKRFQDDVFMLYRNTPSVIVGKHQNALAEVDINYLKEHGIELTRRLSGGGAVYHDLGNINFSFIFNAPDGKLVNFNGYTKPIVDFLRLLSLDAHFGGHNSILIGCYKVSGNAEHIHRNRVLHHGTLLFSSDLSKLEKCLYTNRERYLDKAVRSVRAEVANISNLLEEPINTEDFNNQLFEFLKNKFNACSYQLTPFDIEEIDSLVISRFSSQQWILGYSPSYEMNLCFDDRNEISTYNLRVEQGCITHLSCHDGSDLYPWLKDALVGLPHEPHTVREKLLSIGVNSSVINSVIEKLF